MTSDADFAGFGKVLKDRGVTEACQFLVDQLKQRKQYEELFDARLMQCRHQRGLTLMDRTDLDDLPDEVRNDLEADYLAVCREVGELLLEQGEFRRAWMYLRPAGEQETMQRAMARAEPNDENLEALIELSIYEGIDPPRGFQLLLEHHGTCNSITAFESAMYGRDLQQRRQVAGILIRWVHKELLGNLQADLEAAAGADDTLEPIQALVAGREEMFGEFTTHIDVSHLAAVVRFARIITAHDELQLALDLTEYGRRLHQNLQPPADPPFAEYFRDHGLFFAAQLGRDEDQAVDYFRAQATATDLQVDAVVPIEVYIALLARVGRYDEAVAARAEMIPPDVQTTGLAPALMELSRMAGNYDVLIRLCEQRGDLLGYALGQLQSHVAGKAE
jgi:hypothetical protein